VAERTAIALEKDTHMGTCIACHSAKQAPTGCDTCHAIQSKNGRSSFDAGAAVLARLQAVPARPGTRASGARGSRVAERELEAAVSFLHIPTL
jgi:hypothetical protein